jgi:hypothetical protein
MKFLIAAVAFLVPLAVQCQYIIIDTAEAKPEDPSVLLQRILQPASNDDPSAPYDKARALVKYATLDPSGAREIALNQLAKSRPDIDCTGLMFLDDYELPGLTDAFRANLKSDTFLWHMKCVERYGTADLLPDIVQLYESKKGRGACQIAEGSLGFIVKHDRQLGIYLLEEAVSLRNDTRCYGGVLGVLKNYPGDDALELTLKFVNDDDEDLAMTSASLVCYQPGGREKLSAVMQDKAVKLPVRVRDYIQKQLSYPPAAFKRQ